MPEDQVNGGGLPDFAGQFDTTNDDPAGGDTNLDPAQQSDDTNGSQDDPQNPGDDNGNQNPQGDQGQPGDKKYVFNGREMTADELYEQSRLLEADYRQKTQRLSELEKGGKEPSDAEKYAGMTPEQVRAQKIIEEIESRATDKAREQLQPQIEELKTMAEINVLKTRYPDFDPDKVMAYGMNNRIYDLEKAYKLMNYDKHIEEVKQKTQRQTVTNMTNKRPAGIVPGNSDGGRPTGLKPYNPETDKNKSISELLEEGMRELGGK